MVDEGSQGHVLLRHIVRAVEAADAVDAVPANHAAVALVPDGPPSDGVDRGCKRCVPCVDPGLVVLVDVAEEGLLREQRGAGGATLHSEGR
eukprot:6546854-Lingulodinium_polyedra.AAC.1